MSSSGAYFNKQFSHIYVEKKAMDHDETKKILARLPRAEVILIDHYKDIFNRNKQRYNEQKRSRALILAVNEGELVYKGAPVCQSFGNPEFYYTATAMNCPFDCDYCFLKGMYGTANIVCFVNFEDYATAVAKLDNPYICASYDTDILGLNSITGQADKWIDFAGSHPDVLIELRTKFAPAQLTALPNLIYAFTLSPDEICRRFEKGTPPLKARLAAVKKAVESGCVVRLCFDPMVYVSGWEGYYGELVEQVADNVGFDGIRDVSVGTFRISSQYLKTMRKQEPDSEVCWYPFDTVNGYAVYPEDIDKKMQSFMCGRLSGYIGSDKIWKWN